MKQMTMNASISVNGIARLILVQRIDARNFCGCSN